MRATSVCVGSVQFSSVQPSSAAHTNEHTSGTTERQQRSERCEQRTRTAKPPACRDLVTFAKQKHCGPAKTNSHGNVNPTRLPALLSVKRNPPSMDRHERADRRTRQWTNTAHKKAHTTATQLSNITLATQKHPRAQQRNKASNTTAASNAPAPAPAQAAASNEPANRRQCGCHPRPRRMPGLCRCSCLPSP